MAALTLSAFDRPVVLAHHPALRRALTLGLARATTCAASVRFVKPVGWVDEVAGLDGVDGEWRQSAMTWRLTQSLVQHVGLLPHSARRILEADDTVALLDFARTVAARFRAYLLHRPELLLSWETGEVPATEDENANWQRELWRSLVDTAASRSPAQIVADVQQGRFLCPASVAPVTLVVASPGMPPTVRAVLAAVSRQRDVRWCEVNFIGPEPTSAAPPGSLLGGVQQLLSGADPAPVARPLDDTLTFHACHSTLREIETLRERVIVAMERDETLRPHDVTLYVSSIEACLPAIDAVFGVEEAGIPRLPYSVAGRPYRDRSPLTFAFMRLLAAADGRATLHEIGALLRHPVIAAAAGMTEQEASDALILATQAGIVWGADASDRAIRYGLPPIEAGTWRHGIDRLVLGVAMGRTDLPVGNILPVAGASIGKAELIGRLSKWTDDLFAFFEDVREPRSAGKWRSVIEGALRTFVVAKGPDDHEAMRTCRAMVAEVIEGISKVSLDGAVGLPAIRSLLAQALSDKEGEHGHLYGGIRVCRLDAGAVLPAKVVLIAGVDDAQHPGGGGSLAWDLLAKDKRDGDPDGRADALRAFREAICSARSAVHVAWTGFTMAKHEMRAPSVSVSDLCDIAERVVEKSKTRALVRKEPAHPFAESLFATDAPEGTVRSAAHGWAEAATLIRSHGSHHRPFGAEPLDAMHDDTHTISIDALASCVKDPTLFYCKVKLGLGMHDGEEPLAELEPQAVALPSGEKVDNTLRQIAWRLEAAQRQGDRRTLPEIRDWMLHQPEMPYGVEGAVLSAAMAERWWAQLKQMRARDWQPPLPVRLTVGKWTLIGRLDRLTRDARVVDSLFGIKPHTAFGHWVQHLVMNALALNGYALPRETQGLGSSIGAVDDALAELERLCEFHAQASVAPQPLFRKAGCAWLEALKNVPSADADEAGRQKARTEARKKWLTQPSFNSGPSFPGECETEWNRLCWPDRGFDDDPEFVKDFARVTETVLLPFLRAAAFPEGK